MKVIIAALLLTVAALSGMVLWQTHKLDKIKADSLGAVHKVQDSLVVVRDSLKTEVKKYKTDSIKAAGRILNTRRSTDSSLTYIRAMEVALRGVVPDTLLDTFLRGVDSLGSRVVEERMMADSALATEHAARATAIRLADVEGERVVASEAELAIVTRKENRLLRALRFVARAGLVGGGAAGGAVLAGPPGAAVGALVGALVPLK